MNKLSTLEIILIEEYERLGRIIPVFENKINKLPKGSLQLKNINGKNYYYLQYRDNGKFISKYIKQSDVIKIKDEIKERKQLTDDMKVLRKSVKQIEKALGKSFIYEHTKTRII